MTFSDMNYETWNIDGIEVIFIRDHDDIPFAGAGIALVDRSNPPSASALRNAMKFADCVLVRHGKRWGAVRLRDALSGTLTPPRWHASPIAALKRVGE